MIVIFFYTYKKMGFPNENPNIHTDLYLFKSASSTIHLDDHRTSVVSYDQPY